MEVVVKTIICREHHIAMTRLHDARNHYAAQPMLGKVGIYLTLVFVYTAWSLVSERNPHFTFAVGIYIAHHIAWQSNVCTGCTVVLNRAQRAYVYLVYAIVVAQPYITITMT